LSYKDTIQAKPKPIGQIITIAGAEGSGKTTLLNDVPNRLFVPTEIGGGRPNSMPLIERWEDILKFLDEVTADAQKGQFPFKAISWDSITAMERLLFDYTIRSDPTYGKNLKLSMATAHGAYGKAFDWARDRFAEFLSKCDTLAQYGGIHHVFACHTFVGSVIDTDAGEYSTVDLLLYSPKNNKSYGQRELLRQRSDMIGFITEPVVISKGDKASLATSMRQGRVLVVDATPAYLAKNRYGITDNIPIPKDGGWNNIAHQIYENMKIDLFNREIAK
jgi:hypothetical protein